MGKIFVPTNPTLAVVDTIVYPDGSKLVSGIISGASNPLNIIGVRSFNNKGSQMVGLDLSPDNALAFIRLLATALQFHLNNPNESKIVIPTGKLPS